MQPIHVAIIGGGYGGIRAMEHLSKSTHIHVTLIDQNAYHYMQAEVYDFIANKVDMSHIMIDLPSLTKSFGLVRFVCEEVLTIESDTKEIVTPNAKNIL
jgi:NADH dehydrogenase